MYSRGKGYIVAKLLNGRKCFSNVFMTSKTVQTTKLLAGCMTFSSSKTKRKTKQIYNLEYMEYDDFKNILMFLK